MGKKTKKATRSGHKDKRVTPFSPKTVSQDTIPSIDTVINGVSLTKDTKTCPHLEKGINFKNFSSKISSLESHKCDDCREGVPDRRTKKGKKNNKVNESNSIWVCLECGHFSCGGVKLPNTPQSHAARHFKQHRHPLVFQFSNPNLRWCFICNTIIPIQNGEQQDSLSEFVKALKTQSLQPNKDFDDTITTEENSVNTLENTGGYKVRGLVNLGNTCFFNSVLQNLLAMDKLRDFFFKLEGTIGPLTASLKKLFIESCQETKGKNVINPRGFFGCVCVKAPQFRGFQQHDSHELLRCLLDGLSTEESKIQKRLQNCDVTTFVDDIFGGKISSTVSCLECGYNSVVYEPYLDLSLPLPTKRSVVKKVQVVSRNKKAKVVPKKQGKFLGSKSKKEKEYKVDNSDVKVSVNGECLKAIGECGNEEVDSGEAISWLDYLEPSMESGNEDMSGIQDSGVGDEVTSTMELHNQDPSAIKDSGNSNEVTSKDEARVKVQDFNVTSTTESQIPGSSGIQDSVNSNGVSSKDELWVKVQESEVTSSMESQIPDPSGNQYAGNSNGVYSKDELWVKIQESEVISTSESQIPDSSGIQDSGDSNGVSSKDEPQLKVQESEVTSNTESQIPEPFGIQVSRNSNGVCLKGELKVKIQESQVTSTTESQIPDTPGIQDSVDFNGVSLKDESQLKAQESEVTSNTESQIPDLSGVEDSGNSNEVSTSNGNEMTKEPSEFDGFGGLFNEPEFDAIPLSNGNKKTVLKSIINSESDIDDSTSPISVEKCLAYFTTPELLTKTEHAWQCEQCSKQERARLKGENGISCGSGVDHILSNGIQNEEKCESESDDDVDSKGAKVARDASKRILIDRAPPVLTIHLKRFCQDGRGRLSKLNGHVSFRDTLDLKPYMDPSCCKDKETYKYKLVGVVEHQGSMRGGHCVAYVKGGVKASENSDDCVWYYASDAYVRVASLEEVFRCEAYILFYEAM